ncbi:putative Zn-dependent peptidase [Pedobacter africanus]|uniref:Zn-dependent peptidase n=1 Tax=Pedobacter africanus TaxID=151894 RepID=A0ACC6KS39_9SPHI|nr:hypothetical protein [Pedobacter africanus]MDR6781942.1 putative Zn-dependent peptidase [Pedobacter africanus]
MKIFKKLFLAALVVFAAENGKAQSVGLMDPVSFKLKNGMSIIIAESKTSEKVYAGVTMGEGLETAGFCELLNGILKETPGLLEAGISFTDKGGNVSSTPEKFDNALAVLSFALQHPLMTPEVFNKVKLELMGQANEEGKKNLTEISFEEVKAEYGRQVVPAKTCLVIAGNISLATARLLVKKEFANWGTVYLAANLRKN